MPTRVTGSRHNHNKDIRSVAQCRISVTSVVKGLKQLIEKLDKLITCLIRRSRILILDLIVAKYVLRFIDVHVREIKPGLMAAST